jgi:predicted nuclease of predicted toxin-antitoxin system
MRILFDQGVPRGLAASLQDHEVTEARRLNWERLSNGELLRLAEGAGFEIIVTTDKNVRYQQNLAGRKISIVVLGNSPWWLVRQHLDQIVAAVSVATPGSYSEVDIPFQ